ncbi:MAG TPA: AIR synthase-related protein, partial [Pyrinomonadaceae bacterium]
LEAMRSGAIAGIQDMGAAGLTCSTCEMAARADTGIEIDLSLVPQRETGMTAYEMLLSESQERMLIVAHKGRAREVAEIFAKWDLDAIVIGRVRDDGRMRVMHEHELVCDVPVKALTDEAPIYEREMRAQVSSSEFQVSGSQKEPGLSKSAGLDEKRLSPGKSDLKLETRNSKLAYNDVLLALLSSPNLASKEWVYRQYDHMVRTNSVVLPGADAAVVRIKETRKALAIALDGNGRYCAANPREGAKLLVAEAARNVVCVGARPIAITNCLNFASPERPEVMWSFSEVIDGMAEACVAFNTPVVSGNVSFYNETEGRGILPTPVIGMIGLIEDVKRVIQPGFKQAGDLIALLGVTREDLSLSEYANFIGSPTVSDTRVPVLDLELEQAVQAACLRAAEAGLLRSAHDCSDGGLAVALAECCFSSLNRTATGANVKLPGEYDLATRLFSETPSRIIISFSESNRFEIERMAAEAGCPMTLLGEVGGDRLRIESGGQELIGAQIAELEHTWRSSLKQKLQVEVMAAGAE